MRTRSLWVCTTIPAATGVVQLAGVPRRPSISTTHSRQEPKALTLSVAQSFCTVTPASAAVLICGLQGTIGTTITNLCPRGFVPDHKRMREALGVAPELPATLFYEQYDTEPVIDIKNPDVVDPLKAQLAAARAKLGA